MTVKLNDDKWGRYKQERLREAYAGWHKLQRVRAHQRYAVELWPRRIHVALQALEDPVMDKVLARPRASYAEVVGLLESRTVERRPTTQEELLARFSLDIHLLSLMGGWRVLVNNLNPEQLSRFECPVVPARVPEAWTRLDGALKAWYAMAYAQLLAMQNIAQPAKVVQEILPVLKIDNLSIRDRDAQVATGTLRVILACNGSGKSYQTARHTGWADVDDLVVETGLYNAYRLLNRHRNNIEVPSDVKRDIVNHASTRGCHTLTMQYDPRAIIMRPTERNYSIELHIVHIDEETIVNRLRARQWDEARINKRLGRWKDVLKAAKTNPMLSSSERAKIKEHYTWEDL
jgi:hypothetical protein